MAIKPILFNTEMVRAILDGRKTCTRCICKDANEYTVPDMDFYNADRRTYAVHNFADKEQMEQLSTAERTCPICPGDLLYVRETWCKGYLMNAKERYYYKADDNDFLCTWHPSIHMPKEAARIWLKVTDVRVERLQDMWASDVSKEGIRFNKPTAADEMLKAFAKLWDSTIKKSDLDRYGWNASPWVWVIEFERCEKPKGV